MGEVIAEQFTVTSGKIPGVTTVRIFKHRNHGRESVPPSKDDPFWGELALRSCFVQ